jgi:energy-coupling factor transport system permease protein
MRNISLGRYVPHNTVIHRLDPRTKLFSLIVFIALVFFRFPSTGMNFIYYAIIMIIIFTLMGISHIKISSLFKQLKALWFMMIFLLIINILTYRTADQKALFYIGNYPIYDVAIYQTIYIFIRLLLMVAVTMVLTATTRPLDLTSALEWYMYPLKLIKFPVHQVAMTLSLALRFIPLLLEETGRIMNAQESRGVDFKHGGLKVKVRSVVSLMVPLFVTAFTLSEDLAFAMEARGYDPNAKRTRYRQLRFHFRDFFGLFLVLCALTGGILLLVYKVDLAPYFVDLYNIIKGWFA